MPQPVQFHFDFSSPYGYLAAQNMQRELDPGGCATLVSALYRAYFVDDRDISNPDVAADVAAQAGANREGARAAIDDPAIKASSSASIGASCHPFALADMA